MKLITHFVNPVLLSNAQFLTYDEFAICEAVSLGVLPGVSWWEKRVIQQNRKCDIKGR